MCLNWDVTATEPGSAQWCPVTSQADKHRKFHLNIRKKCFYYEGDQTLEEVDHRYCGISILGDIQNPAGHDPEQPVLVTLL